MTDSAPSPMGGDGPQSTPLQKGDNRGPQGAEYIKEAVAILTKIEKAKSVTELENTAKEAVILNEEDKALARKIYAIRLKMLVQQEEPWW